MQPDMIACAEFLIAEFETNAETMSRQAMQATVLKLLLLLGTSETSPPHVLAQLTASSILLEVATEVLRGGRSLLNPVQQRGLLALFEYKSAMDARAKKLQGKFCPTPFTHYEILYGGEVCLCCSVYTTARVGNLRSQDAEAVWNSPMAQRVRASIHDGTFAYCQDYCPWIELGLPSTAKMAQSPFWEKIITEKQTVLAHAPHNIILAEDPTCNLRCPSCRSGPVLPTQEEQTFFLKFEQHLQEKVLKSCKIINLAGYGEPFASPHYRRILASLDQSVNPDLVLFIHTNAQLFNERSWNAFPNIHGLKITTNISIDAATEATYAILRRGGSWKRLQENLAFISGLRKQGLLSLVRPMFVVQRDNYEEMAAFIEMANDYEFDQVHFLKIQLTGPHLAETYADKAVFRPNHPEYKAFLQALARADAVAQAGACRVTFLNFKDELQEAQALTEPCC